MNECGIFSELLFVGAGSHNFHLWALVRLRKNCSFSQRDPIKGLGNKCVNDHRGDAQRPNWCRLSMLLLRAFWRPYVASNQIEFGLSQQTGRDQLQRIGERIDALPFVINPQHDVLSFI